MSLHWTGPKAWEDGLHATILRERWQNERDEPAYADPDADAEIDPRRCECNPYGSELCLDCQVAEWDARHD